MRRTPYLAALAAAVLAAATQASPPAEWNPLDVHAVDNMDDRAGAALSRQMAAKTEFRDQIAGRFFASSPMLRADFLTAFKAAALRAQGKDRETMAAQLEFFKMLPQPEFHYLQLHELKEAELLEYCATNGLQLHLFRKSAFLGVISKNFHCLVSGSPTSIQNLLQKYQFHVKYQDPVTEFRIELKYKVGANWAEFLIPTGQRYARDFGMVDVWTAAGIISKIKAGPQGILELIKRKTITLHEGKATPEKVSDVQFAAFLPFHKEPFMTN